MSRGTTESRTRTTGCAFSALSNTLLSHFSALGAHRHQLADDEDDATLVPVAKRIGELLGQIAERLNQRQPVEPLADQTAELLAQLEEQSAVSADEQAITLYRPIQSQLRLITEQLAPLGEAANRLVNTPAISK